VHCVWLWHIKYILYLRYSSQPVDFQLKTNFEHVIGAVEWWCCNMRHTSPGSPTKDTRSFFFKSRCLIDIWMSIQKAQNVLKQNAAYVCIYRRKKVKKKHWLCSLSLSLSRKYSYIFRLPHTDRQTYLAGQQSVACTYTNGCVTQRSLDRQAIKGKKKFGRELTADSLIGFL
jgi:hypothetical protein